MPFVFIPCCKLACGQRYIKQKMQLVLFAQWACRGPCGEQEGKALSGASARCVVANSPSPLDHNAERTTKGLLFFCVEASRDISQSHKEIPHEQKSDAGDH